MNVQDVKKLPAHEFNTYVECIEILEAQDQLKNIYAHSFIHQTENERSKYFNSLKRVANRLELNEQKPLDLKMLGDLIDGR